MKYMKTDLIKKSILILLSLAFMLSLFACKNENDESSLPEEISQTNEFGLDTAKSLIERDRQITDMFVNNSLCSKKVTEYSPVISFNEYADYSKLLSALENTYTQSGGSIQAFLSYPNESLPAVKNIDGRTNVFNHIGSHYNGYVDVNSIELNGGSETLKHFTALAADGKKIEFTAVLEEGKWLLQKGIFLLNPKTEEEFTQKFPGSSLGSFMEFSGNILVIQLFVSDKESEITADEEKEFHKKLEPALNYISEQSERYGNEVNISYENLYFDHAGIIGHRPLDFDIVFAETGFGTLQNFAESNLDITAYDNYVVAVCIDKDIKTSFAAYKGTNETEIYYGERVMINKESKETEICVSLLSLLGAYNYGEGICDEYTEALYRRYFPNDIMVSESLTFSEMSPVTAYACGITDQLPPLYRVFYYQ